MSTRAQAEALLTLAESLEACERVGITFRQGPTCQWADIGKWRTPLGGGVNGKYLRNVVATFMSKTE